MTQNEHVLRLTEHRSASLEDAWVQAVPASFWEETNTTVSRTPKQSEWRVQAESHVGIARVKTALGHLTLHVSPKLEGCDSFFLADYAYGQRHQPLRQLPGEQALVDQVRDDPAACLLLWHVLAIHRFSARWLRRDQITRTLNLHGKVKGSIQLSQYLTRHVALADAVTIPCRVRERTQDTPNNRLLKAGLRRAAMLAATLPVPGARRAVRAAVNAALPRFAQVADVPGTAREIRGASTKGPLRHYTGVLNATINFLQGRYLSGDLGTTGATAFLWSMPTLFQEALRGVLSEASSLQFLEGVPTATIHDSHGIRRFSSKVDPDYVVQRAAGSILLLDAKYKNAADIGGPMADVVEAPGSRRIRVPRSDIYQMAAYRQHDRWRNPTGALVYPISLAVGEALPPPYEVRGFGAPIYICFIDVGPSARTNLSRFIAHTYSLAGAASVEDPLPMPG